MRFRRRRRRTYVKRGRRRGFSRMSFGGRRAGFRM